MLEQNSSDIQSYKGGSKKSALFGVFFILLVVCGYAFYAKPLADQVAVVTDDITSKSTKSSELKAKIDEYKNAEEQLGLSTEVDKLEILKSVPLEMDQDEVIRDLIEIADSYDIELHSLGFGKGVSQEEGVSSLRINASFEGNYSDLISFLQGIEQNSRLFKVDSISVQVNKLEMTDISRVNFSLSMETFYQGTN